MYTSDVDNALIAKLGADPELLALCPNGVYWDEAPPGCQRFVIVRLVEHVDEPMFGGTAYEDIVYDVQVHVLSTTNGDTLAAAARVDALLHGGDLTIAGYKLMILERRGYLRDTPRDAVDPSIRWFQRGGQYHLMACPVGDTRKSERGSTDGRTHSR